MSAASGAYGRVIVSSFFGNSIKYKWYRLLVKENKGARINFYFEQCNQGMTLRRGDIPVASRTMPSTTNCDLASLPGLQDK